MECNIKQNQWKISDNIFELDSAVALSAQGSR